MDIDDIAFFDSVFKFNILAFQYVLVPVSKLLIAYHLIYILMTILLTL